MRESAAVTIGGSDANAVAIVVIADEHRQGQSLRRAAEVHWHAVEAIVVGH